ncbi:hypothetical protein Micbo1qcDRAFT_218895 [Microdochium bolleyi]|uniref:Ubiquitin-like protease family profile domain-containing protein n=1 Tax=Microdochium bolleyi TaxID=196109 RepID=A0A136IP60_9PEZI|nr:hypothetical protein Micbo1qcDRAFT_218895 [Microdochium bolleyi]
MFFWQILVTAFLTFLCLAQATSSTLHQSFTQNTTHPSTFVDCSFPVVFETDIMGTYLGPDSSGSAIANGERTNATTCTGSPHDLAHVEYCEVCTEIRNRHQLHAQRLYHIKALVLNIELGGSALSYDTSHLRKIKRPVPPSARLQTPRGTVTTKRNALIQEPHMRHEDRFVPTTDTPTPRQHLPWSPDGIQSSQPAPDTTSDAEPASPSPAPYTGTFGCNDIYSEDDSDSETSDQDTPALPAAPTTAPTSDADADVDPATPTPAPYTGTFSCNALYGEEDSDSETSGQGTPVTPTATPDQVTEIANPQLTPSLSSTLGKRKEVEAQASLVKDERDAKKSLLEIGEFFSEIRAKIGVKYRKATELLIEPDKSKRRKPEATRHLFNRLTFVQQDTWVTGAPFVARFDDSVAINFLLSQSTGLKTRLSPGSGIGNLPNNTTRRICSNAQAPTQLTPFRINKTSKPPGSKITLDSPGQREGLERRIAKSGSARLLARYAAESPSFRAILAECAGISDASALTSAESQDSASKPSTSPRGDTAAEDPTPVGNSESSLESKAGAVGIVLTAKAQAAISNFVAATKKRPLQGKHIPYLSATLPHDWKEQRDAKAKLYKEKQKRNKFSHLSPDQQLIAGWLAQRRQEKREENARVARIKRDQTTRRRLSNKVDKMAAALPPKHLRPARKVRDEFILPNTTTVKAGNTSRPSAPAPVPSPAPMSTSPPPALAVIPVVIRDETVQLVARTPGAWPEASSPVKPSVDLGNLSTATQPAAEPYASSRIVGSLRKGFGWITQNFGRHRRSSTPSSSSSSDESDALGHRSTQHTWAAPLPGSGIKAAQRAAKHGNHRHHPYLGSPRNDRQREHSPEPTSQSNNDGLSDRINGLSLTGDMDGPMPPPLFKTIQEYLEHDDERGILDPSQYNLVPPEHVLKRLAEEKSARDQAAEAERQKQRRRELETRRGELRKLRMPKIDVIPDMSPEWQRKAEASVNSKSSFEIPQPEGTTVSSHDFRQLVPPEVWLNDNVIQAALVLAAQDINARARTTDSSQAPKCVAVTSLFYNRFRDGGVKYPARGLKRWGMTAANFDDTDTILIPINRNVHWTILVIRPSARTIAYVDSFHAAGKDHIAVGKKFIKAIIGDAYNEAEWKVVTHTVPQQTNSYDCGIFAITNGICLALGIDPNCYDARDMPLQRKRIAAAIMNGGFKGEFSLADF